MHTLPSETLGLRTWPDFGVGPAAGLARGPARPGQVPGIYRSSSCCCTLPADLEPTKRWSTLRWLDRCLDAHAASGKLGEQNLFAIIQGGLDRELRAKSLVRQLH